MTIEDAIGNSQEDAKDPRIIGGTPEEMAAKDAAIGGHVSQPEPVLSETPVVDGKQAAGPPLTQVTEVPSLETRVNALEQRIDRIVEAISKSKSVVNL